MGGKHPKSIITDQYKAMKAAIEEIFPKLRHRNFFSTSSQSVITKT
jgi:hypothetical protein